MKYQKPALTFQQQIAQLEMRGVVVGDHTRALRWLQRVSYYRLSAYFIPFLTAPNAFRPGVTFDQICDLYNFDRKLRILFLDAIERIEVGLRTALTYELAHAHGAFGHAIASTFNPRLLDHSRFMAELGEAERLARESFVDHFRRKYTQEPHLPIWMATELLSFGTISRMFSAAHPDIKRRIAAQYGLPDVIFSSWIHSLSVARNICAHHSRLWNRTLGVSPKLPPAPTAYWPHRGLNPASTYSILLILNKLLSALAPRSRWKLRLLDLIATHPGIDTHAMGIPAGALEAPPWDT